MHGILYNLNSWSQIAGGALAVEHEGVLDGAVYRLTIQIHEVQRYNGLGYCLYWPPVVDILTPQRDIWGPQAVSLRRAGAYSYRVPRALRHPLRLQEAQARASWSFVNDQNPNRLNA
jgi:hypothetical protein